MKTRKTLLTLTLVAAASTLSMTLWAAAPAPANAPGAAAQPAPAVTKFTVVDQKNNATRTVYVAAPSEFVGTSAKAASKIAKPSWYAFGHP